MEIASPNSLSSERTHTVGSEGIPHPKTSEELVKELTLSDEVLKQIVAQDNVVPLLKYLDGKREKYAVSKEVEFYLEMIRNRPQLKRALAVKREWDFATELAQERAANLATECAAVKVTLQEREALFREKEIECELGKADMRLPESQRRMEKTEEAYRHLRDKTTDGLKLRLEKSLNGFAMWGLQTVKWVKWLKLDSLERRFMSAKTGGSAEHKQIVELVNTFSEELNEAC
ncbi:hypothetical protein AXG93_2676s1010 [Marchantia polymorpha subsp. ruderalis]|uniref:Uncharacterized protein n=1 Tax=Marchantia polymorpha subsp. ruderalis TaxID=1480154 RepID=A0A176WBQ6_MARPO|nr:hypothetical protein AXG93_2676s1010 [Marchantia polymorpha subsp. ruderalis]